MKTTILMTFVLFVCGIRLNAQQFIDKAVVEYEVKTSIKKTMGAGMWQDMMKDNMSDFKTGYYQLTFAGNKSIFRFDHWDPAMKIPDFLRKSDEENAWYFDHDARKYNMQKNIYGSNFNIDDSIPVIQWHLSNESRIIAGYNCRKAIGKIMDSVYVFAFYTDEITLSGGPCSINGLPGLILGVTIPRMYTSWIATKVNTDAVIDGKKIAPLAAKKYYTIPGFKSMLVARSEDWFGSNEDEAETKRFKEQFFWGTAL